jgi:hypothetical protein
MPTAAKLVAGFAWAVLAWLASERIKPYFPEGMNLGRFSEVNAALGVLIGWKMAGPRAGFGWFAAVSNGLTTTLALLVTGVFIHSFVEMVRLSLRRLYEGPVEALVDVFRLMVEYLALMARSDVIMTLVAGGIFAGLAVEWAGRRWR